MLGGEDDLDDEMFNQEGSGAGTDSKRKGCTKARSLLPSAWTQPHVPPLPTHDSPHDSFEDVLRRESAIYARAHPLRTACALHAHPTAPPAVEEPSIVSWRPTRRPQPSNQASSPAAALPTMPRGPTSPIHPPKIHLATVSRASSSPDECEFTEDLPTTTPRARRPPPCGTLPTASSSSRQALPGVPTRL